MLANVWPVDAVRYLCPSSHRMLRNVVYCVTSYKGVKSNRMKEQPQNFRFIYLILRYFFYSLCFQEVIMKM